MGDSIFLKQEFVMGTNHITKPKVVNNKIHRTHVEVLFVRVGEVLENSLFIINLIFLENYINHINKTILIISDIS